MTSKMSKSKDRLIPHNPKLDKWPPRVGGKLEKFVTLLNDTSFHYVIFTGLIGHLLNVKGYLLYVKSHNKKLFKSEELEKALFLTEDLRTIIFILRRIYNEK